MLIGPTGRFTMDSMTKVRERGDPSIHLSGSKKGEMKKERYGTVQISIAPL